MTRDPELQALLSALAGDFAQALPDPAARGHGVCDHVLSRARALTGDPGATPPATLPAVAHLPAALASAARGPFAATARALGRFAPRLSWTRRASARPGDLPFWDGHANAMLFGPGGLEGRDDLWIGLSLVAPGVTYPDHDHAPEESYLPLGPGEWWNSALGWMDPQGRGLIHNPPGIAHAMRALPQAPLLALWFLPL
jgi:Dimethlysulfonioproprionate lyase